MTQAAPDSSRTAIRASLQALEHRKDFVEFKPCLHRLASAKLEKAADILSRLRPGCKLVIFDALRPRSIQRLLWSKVEWTEQQGYVANAKPAGGVRQGPPLTGRASGTGLGVWGISRTGSGTAIEDKSVPGRWRLAGRETVRLAENGIAAAPLLT